MIQFNLLPDVKLQYIKTQHTKRLVMIISLLAAIASVALVSILFITVQVAQKKHLNDLSKDIAVEIKKLNSTEDLNKILTIQNQLNSLPQLHTNKPITSRIFGYVQQITPVQADISSLQLNMETNTITISGTADSVVTANKFADTVKFATYKSSTVTSGKPFKNVVTSLSAGQLKASFGLTFEFDPALFSSADTPVITVPTIISTRSETEKPATVFKEAPAAATTKTGGN